MGRKRKRQQQRRAAPKPKELRRGSDGRAPKPTPPDVPVTRAPSWRSVNLGWAAVVLAAFVAGAAVAFVVVARFRSSGSDELPPPRVSAAASGQPGIDDFAGADSCEECHRQQYQAWRESVHGKAGGSPSTETVIAPFDGTPIRFADAVVTPIVNEAGQYQFIVGEYGEDLQTFTVAGVIGGGYMQGGGTQGFVTGYPDGTIRFLPFDYIKEEGVWFCNTNSRTDQGWIPITPGMLLAECADWPPIRILGTESNYAICQECHVAQIELAYDSTSNLYTTRLTTLAIDCESCHGPMAAHVARSQPERIRAGGDLAVEAFGTLSKDESLAVCFRCHALKDVLQPGYLPGKPLGDFYSVGFASLAGATHFPDGRIKSFAYQGNHRYSDCYLNGSMTCVDCHDPHTQEYRDIWGRPLQGRFADEQCTDCHPSKAARPEEHTFHEPGADGSRCIDCHMPYLQHPELGHELRFARSDHTIPIPRPGFDDRMGIVNACALSGCHPDSSLASLEAIMTEWYGDLKPHKPIVDALLRIDDLEETRLSAVLLDSASGHPAAQTEAVGVYVMRFLQPDTPRLDREVEQRLLNLARSADLDLRATALAALHLARGEDRAVRRYLRRVLEQAGEADAPLRSRWATALGTFADAYLERGEWSKAITVYRKALSIRPGNASILLNLGLAHLYAGDHESAVASLRESIAADERQPLAWVNLGVSLEALGDTVGAENAYRRAVGVQGDEPLGYFNLGNQFLRRRELEQAVEQYERAVELRPTLTEAYLYLMRAYVGLNDIERAVYTAGRWSRFAPDDPRPREFLTEVQTSMTRR